MTRQPAMFLTDFDGTFFSKQQKIAEKDSAAVKKLQESGVITVIATGRSISSFEKAAATCKGDLPFDFIIFSTGAGIMTWPEKKILTTSTLGADAVETICQTLNGMGLDYMVHAPIPRTIQFAYRKNNGENPDFEARCDLYADHSRPLTGKAFGPATEIIAIIPSSFGEKQYHEIQKRLPRQTVIRATSPLDHASFWVEIFPAEVSKSKAAAWLSRRLQVTQENTLAIGNDYNDTDLLEWAGIGVVVADAPDALTKRFPVAAAHDAGGVADAIWRYGNIFSSQQYGTEKEMRP